MKFNTPIEVTENQYKRLLIDCAGVIAHRIDEQGRYWIKVWAWKYKKEVKEILNS